MSGGYNDARIEMAFASLVMGQAATVEALRELVKAHLNELTDNKSGAIGHIEGAVQSLDAVLASLTSVRVIMEASRGDGDAG